MCGLINLNSNAIPTSVLSCWRFSSINGSDLQFKRIYRGPALRELDSGNSHVCGTVNGTNNLECWQWHGFNSRSAQNLSKISVGEKFVCGISPKNEISCVGSNEAVVDRVPVGSYVEISSGFSHACAISRNGSLICWGDNVGSCPQQGKFLSLALGENRSCALRENQTVVCWEQNGNFALPESLRETEFLSIEAKRKVFCGVLKENFSLYCWGNGENGMMGYNYLVFQNVLPGPCRSQSQCPGGQYLPGSGRYCEAGLVICCSGSGEEQLTEKSPGPISPSPESEPPSPSAANSSGWSRRMVAFMVVGCVGSLSLVLVCCFFLYRYCIGKVCRVHDSGRLDEAQTQAEPGSSRRQQSFSQVDSRHGSGPVLEKRLSHLVSMGNNGTHLEEFSFEVLLEATDNFSEERKIGTGSFGSVYQGKLEDGREVAIKRAEASASSSFIGGGGTKRQAEDKDNAFVRELELLSRLNHKNLVPLLGFYEDNKERVLVYEYMSNGTLHDHLHKEDDSPLATWSARIKVAVDAARGIQYLHDFAVPSIIHRDIKSANILLDDTWTAKVSDFGLSLMGPDDDMSHLSLRAAGTMGYIDPEYFRLQKLTTKSDVYSFGVVLLELLSGHKAIHKNENGVPRNVVDYVVPYIVQDEIHRVLDRRVPPPTPYEIEAVAYVGYLAADCVTLEGRDRPSMAEIVSSLERALAACLARPTLSRSTTQSSA